VIRADQLQQLESPQLWDLEVGNNDVYRRLLQNLQRIMGCCSRVYLQADLRGNVSTQVARRGLVFDDQYREAPCADLRAGGFDL